MGPGNVAGAINTLKTPGGAAAATGLTGLGALGLGTGAVLS